MDVAFTWINTVSVGGIFNGQTCRLCSYLSLAACTFVFSAVLYGILFALPPHYGFQAHFIAISNIAKAWEVVNGVLYEWHQE